MSLSIYVGYYYITQAPYIMICKSEFKTYVKQYVLLVVMGILQFICFG